ncbi:MAG: type I pantothenate kinase [Firmicutes bacterium]|nr:type I pantothenate kinase [Bacillota bacterium]
MVSRAEHAAQPIFSPYVNFERAEWSRLRDATPLTLSAEELAKLRGINEQIDLREVEEVYLPLSRLLNLHVKAVQDLYEARNTFLGRKPEKVPYIIGMAGSVAVGKSTTARILQALLSRWPNHPKVDIVTTDGFLYPNQVLEKRGLMARKGFPESYDLRHLLAFMEELKSGNPEVLVPVYSHLTYDIVPGEFQVIRQPDIVIVEGLNVLQTSSRSKGRNTPQLFVSDFFDFSIYVDADIRAIERWYVERFLVLRETAFQDTASYFHRYATLSREEAVEVARQIWKNINEPNLTENIAPTRFRATLILQKGPAHAVTNVQFRKI